MLKYNETNWQKEEGLQTHSYQVTFEEVNSQSTIEEQKERAKRLSLVKFFGDNEKTSFFDICRDFQKNDEHFYFDRNKKFHTTLLGFPPVESAYYKPIREKIKQYSYEIQPKNMNIKFDLIRLGTKYENNNTLKPIPGVSNGIIIASGNIPHNEDFITFGNHLASFLLEDENLNSIIGRKFRRRFPTVWCTMGHYTTDFKITIELERLFDEYKNLDSEYFQIPCYELELGTSHYKDLRDWKRILNFSLPRD
jgi:hypothetical protein